ncbi:MAG: DNA polymerase IV [Clostridia bacterium]|nr:DNA polymerase IV [Clostridia bacterium]
MADRCILHVDLNNFYAGVECMLDPALRSRAVAVCGSVEERHGIVLAKNYHAKAFGVRTGEAVWEARQKCPHLTVVPPHFEQYLKFSRLTREIYGRYTDQVESYGMDECWLDVTGSGCFGSGFEIAEEIRRSVKEELGLTVSAGVSFNKIFAKLGSDLKKPDAVTCIDRDNFKENIWPLPASELLGVGRRTGKALASYGIHTIGQLAGASDRLLQRHLGIHGLRLKQYACGLDCSPVTRDGEEAPVKSVGHGTTTLQDLCCAEEVWLVMLELVQEVGSRLRKHRKRAKGVAISIRNHQLITKEWQTRLEFATRDPLRLARAAFALFERGYDWRLPIRSVTVRAIDLVEEDLPVQLGFFTDAARLEREERREEAVESIRRRFGKQAVRNAVLCRSERLFSRQEAEIVMPTGMVL